MHCLLFSTGCYTVVQLAPLATHSTHARAAALLTQHVDETECTYTSTLTATFRSE